MSEDIGKRRFREIVPPHLDDAWRLARWLVGPDDAEDVVQDAAIRALAALAGAAPAKPRAWWLAIVRNCALTHARKRRGQAFRQAGEEDADDFADPSPDAEAALIAQGEGARVREALARLPPLLREALMLREIEEMNYREIAAVTASPIGTVMSRLARARAALARLLKVDHDG
jgi:RNA polymerase sigma-70 factor (ECF subfamily)